MYPRILINISKFKANLKTLLDISHKNNMTVMGVSKVFCGDPILVDVMIELGIDYLADSRIENMIDVNRDIEKVLLRLPMNSESELVVLNSNISLNSELVTIKKLNESARKYSKIHKIILMIDLGDLREGIIDDFELLDTVKEIQKLKNIDIIGIGTNLTCYGGIIPTKEVLNKLVAYKNSIEKKFDIKLKIISGGNSSNIDMLLNGDIPKEINNIRLGESIVLGRETAYGDMITGTYDDVFILEAEIIELKDKPTVPIGQIGMNAFGKKPVFEDKGIRKKAIIALGKQDVDHNELIPLDNIEILGSSSDHIILDVSNAYKEYSVGDTITFKLTYSSLLSLMTSKYVEKHYE
jgi:predicted amino acid racemase